VIGVDPIIGGLDRRDAAADAEVEASAAHLIEHADFLDHPQRMMQRQRVDERAEAKVLGALRHRGQEDAGRGGKAERRRVVLGGVIRVETAPIIGLDDLEPLLVEIVQSEIVAIEVVENSEFHSPSLAGSRRSSGSSSAKAQAATRVTNCGRHVEDVA
jgi:hypothetical protein